MKVSVIADQRETFLGALLDRVTRGGHESVATDDADVVIDLDPSGGGRYGYSGDAGLLGRSPTAKVYLLCLGQSATRLAVGEPAPSQIVGFSLIPPVTDSSVLELAQPLQASREAFEEARAFFEGLGFEVVEVPDGPGLVAARVVSCLANEAFSALAEGVADAKTIDTAMKLGTNYPRGPLEWADLIGLPSVLAVLEGLQGENGEDRYRPHPLLKRLVAAGMSVAEYEAKRGA